MNGIVNERFQKKMSLFDYMDVEATHTHLAPLIAKHIHGSCVLKSIDKWIVCRLTSKMENIVDEMSEMVLPMEKQNQSFFVLIEPFGVWTTQKAISL